MIPDIKCGSDCSLRHFPLPVYYKERLRYFRRSSYSCSAQRFNTVSHSSGFDRKWLVSTCSSFFYVGLSISILVDAGRCFTYNNLQTTCYLRDVLCNNNGNVNNAAIAWYNFILCSHIIFYVHCWFAVQVCFQFLILNYCWLIWLLVSYYMIVTLWLSVLIYILPVAEADNRQLNKKLRQLEKTLQPNYKSDEDRGLRGERNMNYSSRLNSTWSHLIESTPNCVALAWGAFSSCLQESWWKSLVLVYTTATSNVVLLS